jgi:dinuclear metal center YbgI/SA1388 family protein
MLAGDLVAPIEQFAPVCMQEKWDNCGFVVGDASLDVSKALIALDCTEAVIDEAIQIGADIVITHHPLIFGGVKKISTSNWLGRIIYKAIKNNIVIYCAHTNMDKAAGGVSGLMAEQLGLKNVSVLTEDGFGLVGDLEDGIECEKFVGELKNKFMVENIRSSEPLKEKIYRVAVCGGSGKSFIGEAMKSGAQAYVTGDITYHDFYCERGFMVFDIGHYASEYKVVDLFAEILCKNFPTFAVSKSNRNNNPIYNY